MKRAASGFSGNPADDLLQLQNGYMNDSCDDPFIKDMRYLPNQPTPYLILYKKWQRDMMESQCTSRTKEPVILGVDKTYGRYNVL